MQHTLYTEDDIAALFLEMHGALDLENQQKRAQRNVYRCVACDSTALQTISPAAPPVCEACGAEQPGVWFGDNAAEPCNISKTNYKRIHHWHERISQLLLQESAIPDDKFAQIALCVASSKLDVLNKDTVRKVLRSLKMQTYIEKWLQIIYRLTRVAPPTPSTGILKRLDDLFSELQVPFEVCKAAGRKNFLNYNYVFCRLFQHLECAKFAMFFPLIKSRQKLRILDETWKSMTAYLHWPFKPLQPVPVFAIRLTASDLTQLFQTYAAGAAVSVAPRADSAQTQSHWSDRPSSETELASRKRPRSGRHGQPFQRVMWTGMPLDRALATLC